MMEGLGLVDGVAGGVGDYLLVTTVVVEAGDAKVVRMTVTVVVVLEWMVCPPVVLVMVAGLLSVLVFRLFSGMGER